MFLILNNNKKNLPCTLFPHETMRCDAYNFSKIKTK